MPNAPRPEGIELRTGQRWLFVVLGALLLGTATAYVLVPRSVTVVAPQCAKKSDGCQIAVSATPDPALVIALLALGAAALLIAVVGYAVTLEVAGVKVDWGAAPTDADEAQAVPSLATTAALAGLVQLSATSNASLNGPVPPEISLALYQQLPLDVAYAADEAWRAVHPDEPLAAVLNDVRHETGRGSYPWFLNLREPDGHLTWLKISKGGRGKRTPTSSFQDPDDHA